jgi:hypothetical protein
MLLTVRGTGESLDDHDPAGLQLPCIKAFENAARRTIKIIFTHFIGSNTSCISC